MKKTISLLATFLVVALVAYAATQSGWIRVTDSCNKCYVNKYDITVCGKCGSYMKTTESEYKDGYMWCTSQCPECDGHTVLFKKKY